MSDCKMLELRGSNDNYDLLSLVRKILGHISFI